MSKLFDNRCGQNKVEDGYTGWHESAGTFGDTAQCLSFWIHDKNDHSIEITLHVCKYCACIYAEELIVE